MAELPVDLKNGVMNLTADVLVAAGTHVIADRHPAHTHSYIELMMVTGGSGFHRSSIGDQQLTIGDVALLRPGAWHSLSDCHDLQLMNCAFSVDVLYRELAWTRNDPLLSALLWDRPYAPGQSGMLMLRLDDTDFGDGLEQLSALERLRTNPSATYRADRIGRLTIVLGLLARSGALPGPRPDLTTAVSPAVVTAIRQLETSMSHPWTVRELAEQFHLAPNYLIRLFKKTTGLPPMSYLAHHRAESAAILLAGSDRPLAEIGASVGWPDQSHFSRRFKAHFGLSPLEFRKRSVLPRN